MCGNPLLCMRQRYRKTLYYRGKLGEILSKEYEEKHRSRKFSCLQFVEEGDQIEEVVADLMAVAEERDKNTNGTSFGFQRKSLLSVLSVLLVFEFR